MDMNKHELLEKQKQPGAVVLRFHGLKKDFTDFLFDKKRIRVIRGLLFIAYSLLAYLPTCLFYILDLAGIGI